VVAGALAFMDAARRQREAELAPAGCGGIKAADGDDDVIEAGDG